MNSFINQETKDSMISWAEKRKSSQAYIHLPAHDDMKPLYYGKLYHSHPYGNILNVPYIDIENVLNGGN